jgi:hypothetical protein
MNSMIKESADRLSRKAVSPRLDGHAQPRRHVPRCLELATQQSPGLCLRVRRRVAGADFLEGSGQPAGGDHAVEQRALGQPEQLIVECGGLLRVDEGAIGGDGGLRIGIVVFVCAGAARAGVLAYRIDDRDGVGGERGVWGAGRPSPLPALVMPVPVLHICRSPAAA